MATDADMPRSWDLERFRTGQSSLNDEPAPAPKKVPFRTSAAHEEEIQERDDGEWLAPAQRKSRPRYVDGGRVFWIAFFGVIVSTITLGLYRFWMVTNLRREIAGSVRLEGDPLEYTGTGIEKLIGFLVAVALLAVYLSIAQLLLVFAGAAIFEFGQGGLFAAAIASLPFLFWAQYRGRAYVMSRLRWRGIRFGMDPGALTFMGLSLLWLVATIVTLGLLYPYMHFKQAQFMANRSYVGSLRVTQGGSWLGLLSYWIWFYILSGLGFLFVWGVSEEMKLGGEGISLMIALLVFPAALIFGIMFVNYNTGAFRYLWDNRSVGGVTMECDLSTGSVLGRYISGTVTTSILTTIFGSIGGLVFIFGGIWLSSALGGLEFEEAIAALVGLFNGDEEAPPLTALLASVPAVIGGFLTYIMGFAVSYAFTMVLVFQPILAMKCDAILLRNPGGFDRAKQRSAKDAGDAGGFATALGVDIGGGI
ncbi:MAG: DUF898 family protein [Pseudomonadota bacterium]